MPVEQLVRDLAVGSFVGQLERGRTEPLRVDDRYESVRQDPADGRTRGQVLEFGAGGRIFETSDCWASL